MSEVTSTPEEPVIIISDLHLSGSADWRSRLERLRRLWRGAGTVIFNGDILAWSLSHNAGKREEVVGYIRTICGEDAVVPILLGGNSDYHLPGPRHLFLMDGRILVLHGDVMFPESSPWGSNAGQIKVAKAEALRKMSTGRRDSIEGQMDATVEALLAFDDKGDSPRHTDPVLPRRIMCFMGWVKNPWRIRTMLRVWLKLPEIATVFMDRYAPQADFLIFGHVHHRGVWQSGGRKLINTGSFEKPARPFVVRIEDGKITVSRVVRDSGHYVPGKVVGSYPVEREGRTHFRPDASGENSGEETNK